MAGGTLGPRMGDATDTRRAPTVGVVVPTYNRRDLLARTLDSLAGAGWLDERVVVVSDGSTDGTDDAVRARGVTLLVTPRAGAAGARNAGWRATNADVVAFVDDDCAVEPEWLDALVAPFADPSIGLVQGQTLPAGAVGPNDRTIDVRAERGLYESCNIAYRRAALEAVGGFDEGVGDSERGDGGTRSKARPWGEDTDLAWRVRRRGWKTAFVSDAVVRHHVFPGTFADSLREEWRRRNFPYLVRKFPELRPLLPGGRWCLRRHSVLAQLALAGAVVAPRSWKLGAALASPYAYWLLRRTRDPRAIARHVSRDAVGSTALLVGSIEQRTLVL